MSVLRAGEAGGLVRQHENASEGHQSATSLVNSSRKQEKGERWRDREMDEMEEMEEMEGEDHHPGPWADLREEPLERGSLPSPAAARPPRPQRCTPPSPSPSTRRGGGLAQAPLVVVAAAAVAVGGSRVQFPRGVGRVPGSVR